jgi:hypothetical protein
MLMIPGGVPQNIVFLLVMYFTSNIYASGNYGEWNSAQDLAGVCIWHLAMHKR